LQVGVAGVQGIVSVSCLAAHTTVRAVATEERGDILLEATHGASETVTAGVVAIEHFFGGTLLSGRGASARRSAHHVNSTTSRVASRGAGVIWKTHASIAAVSAGGVGRHARRSEAHPVVHLAGGTRRRRCGTIAHAITTLGTGAAVFKCEGASRTGDSHSDHFLTEHFGNGGFWFKY